MLLTVTHMVTMEAVMAVDRKKLLVAAVLCGLVLGCGARMKDSAYELGSLQLSEADMRLVHGTGGRLVVSDKAALDEYIARQVSRLAGPAWEEGWLELRTLGAPVVEALIPLLDDTRPTYAGRNARPGVANPETIPNMTLGELAYGLLRDMITQYSDYSGTLPPFDKASWGKWWKENSRSITMSARIVQRGARAN
jgi:hypothetical protein